METTKTLYTFANLKELESERPKNVGATFTFNDATKNLEFVDLNSNENLKEIIFETPQENLRYLDASRCAIEKITIPAGCKKLQTLYLHKNKLKSIIFEGNCPALELIDVSENNLTVFDLPFDFKSLKNLYLYKNQLVNLTSLGKFFVQNDFDFVIKENPELTAPPAEIVAKDIDEVRNWFEQQIEQGTDYIYEAKMLIIGEGGSGKTTLARKIENTDSPLPKEDDRTRGIIIQPHHFKITSHNTKSPKQVDFRLNIWDFGGQEIYHSTHRFFLSKRSLYVLVADNRKDNTHFDYWLHIIELFAKDSPMIIVLNEKDDVPKQLNKADIITRFTNVKEIKELNFKTFEEINKDKKKERLRKIRELINNIELNGSTLPFIGDAVPARWVEVRKAIEADKRNYIDWNEFIKLCNNQLIEKEKDIEVLCGYFHDIGVLLHYPDNPLLKRNVILRPSWATNAVYKIFDNETIKLKYGRFSKSDVFDIWCEREYSEMQEELIELMKQFRLVYEIENTGNLVAPEMLPDNTPAYDWIQENNMHFGYEYKTFMPKGILSQTIVKLNRQIHNQKLVWKSGVVLEHDNTKAEIIENSNLRQIYIRLNGANKVGLLTMIRNAIDSINETYFNLKKDKKVPCICNTCKNSSKPHFYSYDSLEQRIKDNKKTIECNNYPYEDVEVQKILDEIFGNIDSIRDNIYNQFKEEMISVQQLIKDIKINLNLKDMNNLDQKRKQQLLTQVSHDF